MKGMDPQKRRQSEGIGEGYSRPCHPEFLIALASALTTTQQALHEVSPP